MVRLYENIKHNSTIEKRAYDEYVQAKITSDYNWFDLWLKWLQERDKEPEFDDYELEENYD